MYTHRSLSIIEKSDTYTSNPKITNTYIVLLSDQLAARSPPSKLVNWGIVKVK
jgi:hypothetical protein